MAFTVTARHSFGPTGTQSETATTGSTTPTADSLLMVGWATERDAHGFTEGSIAPTGGGWTYASRETDGPYPWDANDSFSLWGALYSAEVGSSPSAHTVTVDSWATAGADGFYSALCADVTGHDADAPFIQTADNGADGGQGNSVSGTVTFDVTPQIGNLILVWFFAGADGGGGFAAPTMGGQSMTQVFNQNGSFVQGCLFHRTFDGSESDNDITCSDVGQTVGNWLGIAIEIAVGAGGEPPPTGPFAILRPVIVVP